MNSLIRSFIKTNGTNSLRFKNVVWISEMMAVDFGHKNFPIRINFVCFTAWAVNQKIFVYVKDVCLLFHERWETWQSSRSSLCCYDQHLRRYKNSGRGGGGIDRLNLNQFNLEIENCPTKYKLTSNQTIITCNFISHTTKKSFYQSWYEFEEETWIRGRGIEIKRR